MEDLKLLESFNYIIGCDEVGRGPIAGPVNACAVKISCKKTIKSLANLKVTDSKKLTDKKRINILDHLGIDVLNLKVNRKYHIQSSEYSFEFCLAEHSHEEIDKMNILQASLSAMKKAAIKLSSNQGLICIDGNKAFEMKEEVISVVKGDSKLISIGLASIIAKVYRDLKMKELDLLYPGYNLGKHAGYPTKEHKIAVQTLGPSPIHRRSFKGVKEFL